MRSFANGPVKQRWSTARLSWEGTYGYIEVPVKTKKKKTEIGPLMFGRIYSDKYRKI